MSSENKAELTERLERFVSRIEAYMPGGSYYETQAVTGYDRVKSLKEDRSNLDPVLATASVFNPDLDPGTYLGGKGSPYVWAQGMEERVAQAERMTDEITEFDELWRDGAFESMAPEQFDRLCGMMAAQTAAIRYGPECLTSEARAADQKLQYACMFMYGQANLIACEPQEWVSHVTRVMENERMAEQAASRLDDKRPMVTIGLDDPDLKAHASLVDVTKATRGCFYTVEAAQLYLDETIRDRIARGDDIRKGLRIFAKDNDPDIQYDVQKTITEAQDRTMPNRKDWVLDRSIQDVYSRTGLGLPLTDPAFPTLGRTHRMTSPYCPEPEKSDIAVEGGPAYRGLPGSAPRFMAELGGRVQRARTLESDLKVLVEHKDVVSRHVPGKNTCVKFDWPQEPAKAKFHAVLDGLTARVLDVKYGPDVARQYLTDGLPGGTRLAFEAAEVKDCLNRLADGDNLKSLVDEVSAWRENAEKAMAEERGLAGKVQPVATFALNPILDTKNPLSMPVITASSGVIHSPELAAMFMSERTFAKQAGIEYAKCSAAAPENGQERLRDVIASAKLRTGLSDPGVAPGYTVKGMVRSGEYDAPKPKGEAVKSPAKQEEQQEISSGVKRRDMSKLREAIRAEKSDQKSKGGAKTEPVAEGPFSSQYAGPPEATDKPKKTRNSKELDKKCGEIKANVPDMDSLNPGYKG